MPESAEGQNTNLGGKLTSSVLSPAYKRHSASREQQQSSSKRSSIGGESKRDRSPSPHSGSRSNNNTGTVNGTAVERDNPLSFLFKGGDEADKHEVRNDTSDGADVSLDSKRIQMGQGNYYDKEEEGNPSIYEPQRTSTPLEQLNGDEQEQELGQAKPRPSLSGRRGSRKSEFQDYDELQHNWRRRLSKFATTPTGLSFIGNAPETPTGESRKWREFTSSILGLKKKERQPVAGLKDIKKSAVEKELDEKTRQRAEFLISSLTAGCPAALFAGSIFLRDEHGTQRAPLLLSLLGVQLTDITESPRSKHKTFRIDLEYGVGINRLKWSVTKDTKDFQALHARLKVLFFQSNAFSKKDVELPKFPRYGHQRKLKNTSNKNTNSLAVPTNQDHADETDNADIENVDSHSLNSSISNSSHHLRRTVSQLLSRLHSISSRHQLEKSIPQTEQSNKLYLRALDQYIDQLLITLALRPQSNRVFQFFELSPIGVLLSSERGYQGKQGYLLVRTSAKAQGWRVGHLKLRELKDMVERHTNKWFLVRNSYIMYVNDIYSTTPLEVFLVDLATKMDFTGSDQDMEQNQPQLPVDSDDEFEDAANSSKKRPYLVIKLSNNERKMKMIAKSEKQLKLWVNSINTMISKTIWTQPKRFDSFAPVRDNCFAQWFVDGRDYMWACSSALEMARETIYIHDWWLSPELYMRRPANGNQQWRIDRILKRKAEQGVKIFVIVYRNVGNTVVTDSSWTKHSLLDLHPNIYVIRSPNQLLQNTYFWAHHEKLCIVDSTVCFLGGIDLCFGRFDTPDHILTDDADSLFPDPGKPAQYFPGKDYSNPRVKDFFSLDKPYESMYDRKEVPRMPWHDVHMVSAGQIARDLSRHFVQRWNYLLRQKRPSRPTPLLLPPSDITLNEAAEMGFTGSCEVQLLRSSGNWSLGLKEHEQSIQNAYLKVIETSEHFVYLENQFFVTSAEWDGTVIHNRIGDALVDRIIRAHHDKKPWRAVIVIPLMPGFESQVSEADGSSVRVIMQCQFMSISRGSTSIFAKLRKVGIDPDDYIQFFSLRKWGKIGPNKKLVTEQLYIHAKTIMADDRVAIIGSANINERSMRGDRDSEVAAIVRDKEMIQTKMNGRPYLAGKFAHTLRMRLMREHLGIDVDILELVERRFSHLESIASTELGRLASCGKFRNKENHILSAMVELGSREVLGQEQGTRRWAQFVKAVGGDTSIRIPLNEEDLPESLRESKKFAPHPLFHTFNHRAGVDNLGMRDKKKFSSDSRIHNNKDHKNDIDGYGKDKFNSESFSKSNKKIRNVIKEWARASVKLEKTYLPDEEDVLKYLNDDGIDYSEDGIDKDLSPEEEEYLVSLNKERWLFLKRVSYLQRCASKQKAQEAKTKSSQMDLHASDAKEFTSGETVSLDLEGVRNAIQSFLSTNGNAHQNDFIDPYGFEDPMDDEFYEDIWYTSAVRNTRIYRMVFHCQPDDAVETWTDYTRFYNLETDFESNQRKAFTSRPESVESTMANGGSVKDVETPMNGLGVLGFRSEEENDGDDSSNTDNTNRSNRISSTPSTSEQEGGTDENDIAETEENKKSTTRRRRAGTFASRHKNALAESVYDRLTAEKMLEYIQGHLVLFPAHWLHKELEKDGSWFFSGDRLPPIEIYD